MNKKLYIGKQSIGDWIFDGVNVIVMFMVFVVTLYPFLYVLFASVSDPGQFIRNIGIFILSAWILFRCV